MLKTTLATLALASALPAAAFSQDWRDEYRVIRFGLISGENETDQLARREPFRQYLERELGVQVQFHTAANYDGTIQALAANQIEFSVLGSSGYAAAWTLTDGGVEPLVVAVDDTGSTGYFSVIFVRCDSGFDSIDDLEGKVLAFADPDSTSGYNVPYYNLRQDGYDPETFFAAIPFSGSHEAGIMGLVNGQFDAAASLGYQPDYHRGHIMAEKGMIPEGSVCPIWTSPEITNSPMTARSNLPREMIDEMRATVLAAPEKDPEAFLAYAGEPQVGFVPVEHDRYQWVIDMREWFRTHRRR
ncbi:phosphate/phosphite/phosphonate ABC transporter substrate-binding protein [uncultured Paracoccus sp.]|uniref:phosphate/phosphite/phosphonate ABC transporter substrate-binding protein n=1 Tax=uncultured Paracoccus sp. TaxID=189685 RepID=UPI0025DF9ADB|nr:phosphate/phosphite/phosphonate ABC transporter substrate-binding protein [uncultured Paracoccus sp.]